jgi:hypothetical protein
MKGHDNKSSLVVPTSFIMAEITQTEKNWKEISIDS